MKEEILDFLVKNEQNNYFCYLYRNNSVFNERREYLLNLLLQDLLLYDLLISLLEKDSIMFHEIDIVLTQPLLVEEKIAMLKYRLFKRNLETYNSVIQLLQYVHSTFDSNKMFSYILHMAQMSLKENKHQAQGKAGRIGECLEYLESEMENLAELTEGRKKVAC